MFGYGSYDKVVSVLDELFSLRNYVCGDQFTAADVYLGSAIMWGTQFGSLPQRDSFASYIERLKARDAFQRAWAKDDEGSRKSPPHSRSRPERPRGIHFSGNCSSSRPRYAAGVGVGDSLELECRPETLRALAEHLGRFGAVMGDPEWLVSAVWLCASDGEYLALLFDRNSFGRLHRPPP